MLCLFLLNIKVNHLCCCSAAKSCLTLWVPMDCSTPGPSVLHCLMEFAQIMSIESMMLSNHLILCHSLLLLLPSIFPSIRVFSSELAVHIRWSKYWSISFSNSPSSGYSGLISFRIDWLDLLAIQGTLKSLLQPDNSKASILQQLSLLYGPTLTSIHTGKTIALTIQSFVNKVMSLLLNTLSRFVIAFLPNKYLLISWLKSPSAVISEPRKIKSVTASTFPLLAIE